MAFFLSSGPVCFEPSWPEERLLTHMLRSVVNAPPEPFTSLQGNHPVDILQSKDAYELRMDAPGFSHEDVVVEVHEDVLKISAGPNKSSPDGTTINADTTPAAEPPAAASPSSGPASDAPAWKVLVRERNHKASWTRAFLLPENADADHISVQLDRGLLTVRVPIRPPPPKPEPRRITINKA